jgi:beta-mannanase
MRPPRRMATAWLLVVLCGFVVASCTDGETLRPAVTSVPAGARLSVPVQGAYIGAYIEFGDTEDQVTLEAIEQFEGLAGKRQAIIASSSYWGEGSFPARNLELIARHGALPLVYWSPWDRPYTQKRGPDRFRLESILAGEWDGYIDTWAYAACAFNRPLLVSWGLEMNGNWFPWSGCFYNVRNEQTGEASAAEGPEIYKRAYRYVVDRVRWRGAGCIQWVFHPNNLPFPQEPWNRMAAYYPGAQYVDWLGLSVYGMQFREGSWTAFDKLMEPAYRELCQLDPFKPVILAEWGVGEFPGVGDKAAWLREAFRTSQTDYPRLKAAVYWHERWQNADETYSNLRINSSPEALAAFRDGVADPFWHGSLLFRSSSSAGSR